MFQTQPHPSLPVTPDLRDLLAELRGLSRILPGADCPPPSAPQPVPHQMVHPVVHLVVHA